MEIHRPLAGDIVRDLDIADFAAFEKGRNYVISIYISKIYSDQRRFGEFQVMYRPFTALEITDGIWKDKTMACTHRLDDATRKIVLPATGVGLIYSVELGPTALNLGSIRTGCLNREQILRTSFS